MQKITLTSKTIQGLTIRTNNAIEMNSSEAQIGHLWERFFQTPMANANNFYGVYYNYESDYRGDFNVMAGIEPHDSIHDLVTQYVEIAAGDYLIFKGSGAMPKAVIEAWKNIWDYFSSSDCVHSRAYKSDFELYVSANEVEIYIGVIS